MLRICLHNSLPIDPPAPVIQTDILLFILAFNSFLIRCSEKRIAGKRQVLSNLKKVEDMMSSCQIISMLAEYLPVFFRNPPIRKRSIEFI